MNPPDTAIIDEYVLKPAAWKLEDYEKAKAKMSELIIRARLEELQRIWSATPLSRDTEETFAHSVAHVMNNILEKGKITNVGKTSKPKRTNTMD